MIAVLTNTKRINGLGKKLKAMISTILILINLRIIIEKLESGLGMHPSWSQIV